MATTSRKDLPGTNAPNWSQRVTEELRVLMGRGGNGRALTAKDLIDSGIAKPGAGGGLVPGVPGGGDIEPDLTPPPMPTGFAVTAGLSTVFVEHDAPGYTQGHGHDRTVVYGVLQTGSTAPTFDQAVVLFQFQGTIGAYPAALGTRYRLWIKWQSKDGVQSVSPAGGINGLDVQTGKIGNNDLGPLIVEAGNLANGSVSASKLAAQAVDATKFANGIEPVSVSTAATLPTVKSTSTIVWQGKLYRWDGSKYTAAVPTVDLTGTIIASQIAAGAVDVTKFASGIEPVTNSAAASLPTVKSTTVITWQGKLYRWDGSKYSAEVAVVDLAGQIDAAKLADNAVTVSKIAAGAVEAGKLATGAVTADKIAAAAVDATKFASGIEPVTNSAAASLPTVKSTTVITWQGKLYRWDGSKYSAEVAAVDLTGQIDSAKLADNAVTVSKIAAGAVDAGKLASGAVTTDKIAAAAVDATKFASGIEPVTNSTAGTLPTVKSTTAITWQGKLYRWDGAKYTAAVPTTDLTGTVIASQIAAGAVDATKFASGIEPVTNSTAGTLPTVKSTNVITWQGKLYRWDGAKYSAEVAVGDMVGQIAATQIADNAITTPKLAANSVAAGKIAANAVTANTVAADAITAGKIAAGAVNTRELAAGSVTAGKLVVTATDTVNVDPFFQDADMWANANFTRKSVEGAPGPNVLAATIATSMQVPAAYRTPIDTSKTYLFETWFIATAAQTNRAFASIRFYDVNGVLLTGADAPNPGAGWPGTNASAGNFYFPAVGAVTPTTWTRSALTVGPNGVAQFPAKAAYFTAGAYLNYGSVAPIVESQWGGFRVTEMARGELIVDGAVTANSIAAGAVTAGKIAANAVTANEIATNAITTAKIQAGAVTTAELAAGAVTASKMVITDPSTLVPDADYSDALMWAGGQGGTINIVTTSNREYNTLDNRALQLNRVQTGTDWDSAFSSKFSLRENTGYRIRTTVYVPAACTFKVRLLTYDSANASGAYKDIDVVATGAGWHSLEDTFTSPGNAAGARALVYIHETSTAAYLRMGKFYVQERTTASLIVDGTITAAKLAAKTITAAEIAAGTITAAELGANSVTAGKIAAGTVTANELATNSVTAIKVAAGAITAGKIAANAVTANEIAANAVTTAKIAAGAVSATEIAAATILASKLVISDQSNMLADSEFLDTTGYWNLSTAELSTDAAAVAALNCTPVIVNRAGTTARFDVFNRNSTVYMSVEPGKVYRLSIQCFVKAGWNGRAQLNAQGFLSNGTTGSTSANSYGTDYRVNAVAADTTFTLTLDYTASATTSFLRFRILADFTNAAVAGLFVGRPRVWLKQDADLIVDGAIIAAKLAAGSVTANAIAANSVTTNAIAANAVTANEIAANAVTTAKIAAGAVSADQIAANAITVKQLTVMDYSNIVLDPFIQDTTSWATFTGTQVTAATAGVPANMPGPAGILLSKAAAQSVLTRNFQTSPGEVYYLSAYVASPTTTGYAIRLMMQFIDPTGAQGEASGTHVGWAAAITLTAPAAVNTWQKIEGFVTVPAGVAFGRARIVSETGSAIAGSWYATNFVCRRATSASLIVDGAITATKIAANAIAVGSAAIQDGAIVNAMIGNLSADKINAGTLNAARIAAGTITSSHLSANSVIAGKIAANAVTAGTIAANAVTATQIAAGSITVDKLAAGSVTADKLTVGTGGNLCPDSAFTPGLAFWGYGVSHSQYNACTRAVNLNADYSVPGSVTAYIFDNTNYGIGGSKATYRKYFSSSPVSVLPGERMEASLYLAFHRCHGEFHLEFFNETGWIGGQQLADITSQPGGGRSLGGYYRAGGFVTVPAGATYCRMTVVAGPQLAGTTNANYVFMVRPFIGRAHPNQTELSPWTPGSNTNILPDGITTPSISALAGKFGDIEIRPTAGASGCIRVYDSNGTLRVRLGVW
ncbi:hypothetical protein KV708_09620 [Comamonas thiooxydans]|uniref:beta strand repeat-containing protein n=1 Tax=Comamonas thiooxydans TaxID=363952 RepID=UPI000710BCDC|nr:hypothetical protein [Comamonas thiooxydans]